MVAVVVDGTDNAVIPDAAMAGGMAAALTLYTSMRTATCWAPAPVVAPPVAPDVPSPTSSTAKGAEHVPAAVLSTKLLGHVQLTSVPVPVKAEKKFGLHVHVAAAAPEVE